MVGTPLNPIDIYKFCSKCAGAFRPASDNELCCSNCGYSFFVNTASTAVALIVDKRNRALLVRRKFEPYNDTWQMPGGFIKPEESAERAVAREVEEELGLKIKVRNIIQTLPTTYPYQGVNLPILTIYISATVVEGSPHARDDVAEVGFFDKESLEDLRMAVEAQRNMLAEIL